MYVTKQMPSRLQGSMDLRRPQASAIHELLDETRSELTASRPTIHDHQLVLDRLERIEAALGISDEPDDAPASHDLSADADEENCVPLRGVWKAVSHLRLITRPTTDENIWSRPIVKRLWSS